MPSPKARSDYARWKAGFEEANALDIEARRRSTADEDFAALARLMEAAQALGWSEQLREGEAEVRERWLALMLHAS